MLTKKNILPMTTLLLGASIWGVAWYPFRLLQQAGISGELSTALTYLIALLTGLILFHSNYSPPKK